MSILLASGCYLAFLLLWFALAGSWRAGFAATGNALLGRIGPQGRVQFEPMARPQGVLDTHWRLSHTGAGVRKSFALSARYHTYVPFAVLASLVLAAPVPWRRRGVALALGVLLVAGFVWLRLWLRTMDMFIQEPAPLYQPAAAWRGVLAALVHLTYHSPLSSVVAPALIWILVTFRQGDWSRLRHGTAERGAGPRSAAGRARSRGRRP